MALESEPSSNYGWSGKLILTPEQKDYIHRNFKAAKFAYNWAREQHEKYLVELEKIIEAKEREYIASGKPKEEYEKLLHKFSQDEFKRMFKGLKGEQAICGAYTLSNLFTQARKENVNGAFDCTYNVDSASYRQAITRDYLRAINGVLTFLSRNSSDARRRARKAAKNKKTEYVPPKFPRDMGFPTYKRKVNSYMLSRFKVDEHVDYERNRIKLYGLGWVKVYSHRKLPKYSYPSKLSANARITFDGIDYYISFSFYKEPERNIGPQTGVLGVSFGINNMIGLSNGKEYDSSSILSDRIEWLEDRIKCLNKHIAKLYTGKSDKFAGVSKDDRYKFKISSRQTRYLRYLVRKSEIELNNCKKYQKEKIVNDILSTNPSTLVVPEVNVRKLQRKNPKFSPKLQRIGLYDLRNTLVRKAVQYQISVREPSSTDKVYKICHACNKDGILKGNTFVCPHCGVQLPAKVNTAKYYKEHWLEAPLLGEKKKKSKECTECAQVQ